MTGLLKKDLMLIMKNISPAYFLAILPPVVVSLNNPAYFLFILSVTVGFLSAAQVSTTLDLDEKVHWQRNVMSMPVSIAGIAMSKYILTLILAGLAGAAVALISSIYLKDVVVIYGVITLLMVVFYNAVVIPVSYRFGTGASRYFIMFFISVPIMFVYIFKIFDIDFQKILMSLELKTLYLLMWALGAASLAVSVLITIRVIRKCLSGPGSWTAPEQLKGD
ncbi:MAG: ABC-2 transporter permease [Hungatella sp.]|nr:ABC-2 transporter permease [Hungatella sp.]